MRYIIALLLVSLIFVTACGRSEPTNRPLYSGSEGIVVTFPRENARTMYSENLFTISVRMQNDGATDVPEGWITAVFDPAAFTFQNSSTGSGVKMTPTGPTQSYYTSKDALPMNYTLKGRAPYIYVGEVDYADFTFQANKISGNRDDLASSITFQACYPYNTTFISNVCIARDIYNTETTKACIERAVTGNSQGAPIAVTRVEPSFLYLAGDVQPRFKITLTNLKDGYTLWNDEQARLGKGKEICNQVGFSRTEFAKIKVSASMGNTKLECGTPSNKSGIVRFESKTAEVICTYPGMKPGANYESSLIVQAQYFYVSSLTAEFNVENVEVDYD